MQQPDFGQLWFDSFATSSDGVEYEIRSDSNRAHDLIFMSSLLHDARVLNVGEQIAGDQLSIRLNRDCWERGYVEKAGSVELYVADALLTLGQVREVNWLVGVDQQTELWLDYLWMHEDFRTSDNDRVTFSLVGNTWRCDVLLDEADWSIRLKDTEAPYLWSVRHQQP